MRFLSATNRRRARPARAGIGRWFEAMEGRLLLTATPTGYPTLSAPAETTGPFSTSSYIPVEATPHGTGSYYYDTWAYLEYGTSSAVFGTNSGASAVNTFSLSLDNTATTGNYASHGGNFAIFVIPSGSSSIDGTVAFQGKRLAELGEHDLSARRRSGPPPANSSTLGIPTNDPTDYEIGYWTTTSMPTGYSTFTGSTTARIDRDQRADRGLRRHHRGLGLVGQHGPARRRDDRLRPERRHADPDRRGPPRTRTSPPTGRGTTGSATGATSERPQLNLDITQAPLVKFSAPDLPPSPRPTRTPPTPRRCRSRSPTPPIRRPRRRLTTRRRPRTSPPAASAPRPARSRSPPDRPSANASVNFNDITTSTNTGTISITLSDPGDERHRPDHPDGDPPRRPGRSITSRRRRSPCRPRPSRSTRPPARRPSRSRDRAPARARSRRASTTAPPTASLTSPARRSRGTPRPGATTRPRRGR